MRALIVCVVLVLAACAKAPDSSPEAPAERRASTGAWLGTVRSAHAAADAANTLELRQQALAALRVLASGNVPEAIVPDEAASLRRDLYAHAVRLALDLKYLQLAESLTSDGLALEGNDPFRTQLLILAAETYRALGHAEAEAKALALARQDLGLD